MLDGAAWGCVAAWIISEYDEPDVEFFDVPRHPGAEERIREAVAQFWTDVEFGNEPSPDYARDADLIAALEPEVIEGKRVDLTGDNMLPVLLAERAGLKARAKEAERRLSEIDAEIRHKMGDAEIGIVPGFTITLKQQHRKATILPASTTRVLRVTDQREKEEIDDGPF